MESDVVPRPWRVRALPLAALTILLAVPALLERSRIEVPVQAQSSCGPTINPIVCENMNAGDASTTWDVTGAGDSSIQGFATNISVTPGQTQRFKIKTPSTNYGIDIYRMGYYNGAGARKIASISPSASLPQSQPNCLTNSTTGLIDCGNWAVSASWTVPSSAVSGIYFAKLNRHDSGGSSHIVFIVRESDAASHKSDLVFQTSDTTWQAYNQYGGNSLYVGNPAGRAYKVSYNRPITTRDTSPEDFVFNAEYPMVRFLEANGFDVSYISGVDTDRSGATILQPSKHKAFLSVGHDEYWSGGQRANVEAARAAGLHLAFFSGNEVFWKTRWENSIDSSNTSYRTLVTYKETHANAVIDPLDPPTWTGTWRDARFSPPADGGRPENALTGQLFMVNAGSDSAIKVPSANGKMRFWRNTTVATLGNGQTATMPASTLGYEWDADVDNGFKPTGLIALSSTSQSVSSMLLDNGSTYGSGSVTHKLSLYRDPSGALVFGAGTVQWSWGLDNKHDRGSTAADVRMKQATVNLLADMGAQPGSLTSGLVAASASTDVTPPTSVITAPAGGAFFMTGTTVTITGTAAEAGGGQLVGVEVSTDGGATWKLATGTTNWTFSWAAVGTGSVTFKSRGYDDSGNMETPSAGVTIVTGTTKPCPCSIWSASTVPPAPLDDNDVASVELGTKFQTDTAGYITGVRFYKVSTNVGTHTGSLWTIGGTELATVTFTNETASGWQQADFSPAIAVAANTTYVVSYHAPTGHYTGTDGFFVSPVNNTPLYALSDGASGPNGVYKYSAAAAFPTDTWMSENYWVDVVFNTTPPPDTVPPTIATVAPAAGASGVPVASVVTATFSETLNAASVTTTTMILKDPSNATVSATVSYNAGTSVATLTPASPLSQATTYTATVKGGAGGVRDTAGNNLAADVSWSFTTVDTTPPVVTAMTPPLNATGVSKTAPTISATFNENVNPATISGSTFELRDASGMLVAATVSYNGAGRTATLMPSVSLAAAATYTVRVVGGSAGVKDTAGNALAADVTSPFTTAGAPAIGATASGRYTDGSSDSAVTNAVLTRATTNFVVYVAGEGGSSSYPTMTDTYGNTWTPQAVRQTSSWPGFLWVFTSFNAHGGPGHTFTATKPHGLPTILVVEVTGTSVAIGNSAIGTDDASPFSTAVLPSGGDALLLGAFAPGYPGQTVSITPANGFAKVVEETHGDGAWVASVASRRVSNGSYSASWTMSGGADDFDFAVDLLVITGAPVADTTWPAVTGFTPSAGAVVSSNLIVSAGFGESLDPASVTSAAFELRDSSNQPVAGTVNYDESTHTARFQPSSVLPDGAYVARIHGGAGGVKDLAGNPMAADVTSAFTAAAAPTLGVSAKGRYSDASADIAQTAAVTTHATTNLVVFVHGEAGADFPAITDTYNNTWARVGMQESSLWPGYLWVFTSLNAHGGANHQFTATKPDGFETILAVEVVGSNVVLAGSAFGIDDVSPFATPAMNAPTAALLLGAFAPGFPQSLVTITPGGGFATVVEEANGDGAWVASIASRTVQPGSYSASWQMAGGVNDFDFATGLLAFAYGAPDAPTVGASAKGRYDDESADEAETDAFTTQASTNLIVYVHGEGGNASFPTITDNYHNVWMPVGVQQSSHWPGYLWIFRSFNAAGGPDHRITAAKPNGYPTVLAVEVLGSNLVLDASTVGIDNISPFSTGPQTITSSALLLGAFAPGFPQTVVDIKPVTGFSTVVEETAGDGAWVASVAARSVVSGVYDAGWIMTGGVDDFDFATSLIVLKNGT